MRPKRVLVAHRGVGDQLLATEVMENSNVGA